MTHRAILWETAGLVVWACRRCKIRPVAVHAISRKRRVLIVRVALVAGNSPMGAGKREPGIVVRKGGWPPHRRRVTCIAVCRESPCDVVWIRRRGELGGVARITIYRSRFECDVLVARDARYRLVCAGQRESRQRIVVKRIIPRQSVYRVAFGTIC